jgi:hypothetical protein
MLDRLYIKRYEHMNIYIYLQYSMMKACVFVLCKLRKRRNSERLSDGADMYIHYTVQEV